MRRLFSVNAVAIHLGEMFMINVSGKCVINGGELVVDINGRLPRSGESFTVMNCGEVQGRGFGSTIISNFNNSVVDAASFVAEY